MAVGFSLPGEPFKLTPEDMGRTDYGKAIQQGFQTFMQGQKAKYTPKTLAEELLKTQISNKLEGAKVPYADRQAAADLQLKQGNVNLLPLRQKLMQAQAERQQQLANLPFGGQLSGAPKEAFALEMLKRQQGEDSQVYQNAKQAYDLAQAGKRGTIDYHQSLIESAPKRASTQLTKSALELNEAQRGFLPGSNEQIQLSPQQQQEKIGQLNLKLQKETTDLQTRQKVHYATNIDKTIDAIENIGLDNLTQYSGPSGHLKYIKDVKDASLGRPSKSYEAYTNAATASQVLAHQVRQFYGDSIQPSMIAKLEQMTNPESWIKTPQLAKSNFNTVKNILESETQTYRDALRNIQQREKHKDNDPLGIR